MKDIIIINLSLMKDIIIINLFMLGDSPTSVVWEI